MTSEFDLDTSLFNLNNGDPLQNYTIRNAVEGIIVLGSLGSGKSSSSGSFIAKNFLAKGFGGLVLTCKPEEAQTWKSYAEQTNRTNDLIIIEPGCNHSFNFIQYEASHIHSGKSFSQNLVEVLETVLQANDQKEGKMDDVFWQSAQEMILFFTIDLLLLAYGTASVQSMYDIVATAPKYGSNKSSTDNNDKTKTAFEKAFDSAKQSVMLQVDTWKSTWTKAQQKRRSDPTLFEWDMLEELPDARLLKMLDQFFLDTYYNLSEKTRSVITFSFSAFLQKLLREPFYSLFCQKPSTFSPEDCLTGKIIILNLPTKLFQSTGRSLQTLFKYVFQRAMEKRNVAENDRPLFIFADEAQEFLHPHDIVYQATARSSRICTVYLTQNLSNLYGQMPSTKAEHLVNSFLGTLNTKIFHGNSDALTNKYASDLFGQAYMEDPSRTVGLSGKFSVSKSLSYKLEQIVRPEHFHRMRNGSKKNDFLVDAYMHIQAHQFEDGMNFKKISFKQN